MRVAPIPLAVFLSAIVLASITAADARNTNKHADARKIGEPAIARNADKQGVELPTKTRTSTDTSKIRTPVISATLSKAEYQPGETMVLTVQENIWAKRTFIVSDSSKTPWGQTSDNNKVVTFKATAASSGGVVDITMIRTFDNATATDSVTYTVPAPPPPPPPPPPSAAWPGQQPGQFYLGMSCGTACSTKISQLGQGFGVHRQFRQWGDLAGIAKDIQEDHAAGRLPWLSVKPPVGGAAGWAAVANGSYDADIKALAATLKANDDTPVLITFHHEPCNDGTEADAGLWAGAYVRMHDVLKAEGALVNVADPPIMSDWLFDPRNRGQEPSAWLTDAVLQRAPFMGVDVYENETGETFVQRIPRVTDYLASRGYPNMMVGVGETGSTDAKFDAKSAVDWINESLTWAANNTDKIGVVSYFNSTANSKVGVYWPLDESAAKLGAFRGWLDKSVTFE